MKNWFFEQMAMYSAYHRDGRNQATHHVGVPLIVFSLIILLTPITLTIMGTAISLASVLIALLMLVYLIGAPLVGLIATVFYGALVYAAAQLLAGAEMVYAVKLFAVLFVVGWIIQFWGHSFEGRKPALFDNLVQVFIAPAFLIAEILFALGQQAGLKAEINARIAPYLPKAG